MIDWKEGKPDCTMDFCLVIYMDDYEFGMFDGEIWEVCLGDRNGYRWVEAQEPIRFYALLNKPDGL